LPYGEVDRATNNRSLLGFGATLTMKSRVAVSPCRRVAQRAVETRLNGWKHSRSTLWLAV